MEIYEPYLLQEGMVDFKFSLGTAGCSIRIKGIGTEYYNHETYGVDTLQALQLASNVESILKRISKKYELFFEDGEPYFE